jgi:ribosomal protein S18 acetylase RimI-like enzyme
VEEDPVTEDDEIRLRVAGRDDIDVLWMALGQNPSDEEGESEEQPTEDWPHEYRHYVEGWMRPGDAGVIAEIAATGEGIGAAWHRLFPVDDPAFGFVDADTPELGISIRMPYRSRGIGARLLDALLEIAAGDFAQISLDVLIENERAVKLYRSRGFEVLRIVDDDSYTMLRPFQAP